MHTFNHEGLGLNLKAADTVIMHDLDFNPKTDVQVIEQIRPCKHALINSPIYYAIKLWYGSVVVYTLA
jgi:hypothetical protein